MRRRALILIAALTVAGCGGATGHTPPAGQVGSWGSQDVGFTILPDGTVTGAVNDDKYYGFSTVYDNNGFAFYIDFGKDDSGNPEIGSGDVSYTMQPDGTLKGHCGWSSPNHNGDVDFVAHKVIN